MEPRTLKYVAESCHGAELHGDKGAVFSQVSTDSRKIAKGDLFVALRGDRFDGHDFVTPSFRDGAVGALVDRDWRAQQGDCHSAVVVDDTIKALSQLAGRYRREFELPVIAVAGSNGKTSTKELLASTVGAARRTLKSEASFNNHIGVPLTLLRLEADHQIAVLEVGTNHPGELGALLETIAPQIGVLTNIGREHLEHFGDLEGVAKEEGFLAERLPADGVLFVNADSPLIDKVVARARAKVVRVGMNEDADWRVSNIRLDATGSVFSVKSPKPEYSGDYRVNLLGRHQVTNALLAIAVAAELNVSSESARDGLSTCRPAPMRMEFGNRNGVNVINDAYNANADSAAASLQTLSELPCQGRRLAVLGDMAELGSETLAAHSEIGVRTARAGVGVLWVTGEHASVTSAAAREAGLPEVREFPDCESLAMDLRKAARPGDLVLIKASRAARMERIAEALLNQEP